MINSEFVVSLHEIIIEKYDGIKGLRDINASQIEKYEFVIKIAKGQSSIEQITMWISNHITIS